MKTNIITLGATVLVGAVAAGCGGASNTLDEGAAAAPTTTTVYFVTNEGRRLVGVPRPVPPGGLRVRAALDALVSGPSKHERDDGVATAIPSDTRVENVDVAGSVATVHVAGLPAPGKPIRDARIVAQIVRTAVGLSGVNAVAIRSEGRPWGLIDMQGKVGAGPYGYDALAGWGTVCTGRAGTETVAHGCFTPLP